MNPISGSSLILPARMLPSHASVKCHLHVPAQPGAPQVPEMVTAIPAPWQTLFSSSGRTEASQPLLEAGNGFPSQLSPPKHIWCPCPHASPWIPGDLEDKRPSSKRKKPCRILSQSTTECREPGEGVGWWGRPQAPPWPSSSPFLLPDLGGKGEKKEERKGRAARERAGGAGSIPSVFCQLKPLCWGLPEDATDSSLRCRAANPISAPGHSRTAAAHRWRQRPEGFSPAMSRCAHLSFSSKRVDQTPTGSVGGSSNPCPSAAAVLKHSIP